ncbi:uncharacterized protein LOC119096388 [Pollicipes pollicipes]|uniref:uncharacterized protein LOC119096388 n=1 Tax=Pollicipes pollicipes TaxID=41117 RepID=UPI0018849CF5|nr:uncharacterized protein LOC119096388 [Pollicipes pollicipes]
MGARREECSLVLINWSPLVPTRHIVVTCAAILFICIGSVSPLEVTDRQGRIGEPLNCYSCHSQTTGEACKDGTLIQNKTEWQAQCSAKHTACMVRVYKSSSTVNKSEAHTSIWSVERACAEECEPDCLTIGERTKIISCISCCTEDLCNYADGAATWRQITQALLWVAMTIALVLQYDARGGC